MKDRAIPTIFLVVFIDLLGYGIILPLLPFIAEKYGANPFEVGLLVAVYSLFQLISTPIIGRLSDKYGRRKLLIFSQLGSAFGFILLGISNALPLLFLSRVIDGITGGNISVAQAYIADVTTQENRARGMGVINAAFGLGFIFGPVIGGLLSGYGFLFPALFAAACSFITVFTTYFFLKESVDLKMAMTSNKTDISFKELLNVLRKPTIGVIIISFFLVNTAFSVLQGTFALWTQKSFNFGPSQNGILFTYIGVLSIIIQLRILPFLINRVGERKLLKNATLILSLGFLTLPIFNNPILLFVPLGLIALGNGLSLPTTSSVASEEVPREDYGGILGLLQSSGAMGRIIGPIMGGVIFYSLNSGYPFIFSFIIVFVTFVLLFLKLKNESTTGEKAITRGMKVIPQ